MKSENLLKKANLLFKENEKEEAFNLWLILAKKNDPIALRTIAWCYLKGECVNKDIELAFKYANMGLDVGNYSCYGILADIYHEKEEYELEYETRMKGVQANDVYSIYQLAFSYYYGRGISRNERLAAYYATKAYEIDSRFSEVLALCYKEGVYFPIVHSYSKYLFLEAGYTVEWLDENLPLKDYLWKDVKSTKVFYPSFKDSEENFFTDPCPYNELLKLNEVYPNEETTHNNKANIELAYEIAHNLEKQEYPLFLREYALWMFHDRFIEENYPTYYIEYNEEQGIEYLFKCAKEYKDLQAISALAILSTSVATPHLKDQYLGMATNFWNERLNLHQHIKLTNEEQRYYNHYQSLIEQNKAKLLRLINDNKIYKNEKENAIVLTTCGELKKVHINFANSYELGNPINAKQIHMVLQEELTYLSDKIGYTIVGYADELALFNGLENNNLIEKIVNTSTIFGDIVLCGYNNNQYQGLPKKVLIELENIYKQ